MSVDLRDHFAGLAMRSLFGDSSNQELAFAAYRTADAMLAERERGLPQNERQKPSQAFGEDATVADAAAAQPAGAQHRPNEGRAATAETATWLAGVRAREAVATPGPWSLARDPSYVVGPSGRSVGQVSIDLNTPYVAHLPDGSTVDLPAGTKLCEVKPVEVPAPSEQRRVEPNRDKPHRCPECHRVSVDAREAGSTTRGKDYGCNACGVVWKAP